jgi:oligopeptide/dipeptide ABC transporter ATP-binding protein
MPALPNTMADDGPLLEVRDLRTYYPVRDGVLRRRSAWVKAVDGVSLHVGRGETFGLVGESGCGKTTLGRSVVRLTQATSGEIRLSGQDITQASGRKLRRLRRDVQLIFQDPYGSLNPRMSVGDLVAEGLVIHGELGRREREQRVAELLSIVGLRREHMRRYPHEFSGGQRQRIGIARALALRPKLVIADEPVAALDVSIQSQVLNLLSDLQQQFGLSYLFIAHDLGVVRYISDRVGVMYLGNLVEVAPANEVYEDPRMPYTQALLSAIPSADGGARRERIILRGDVPSPIDPPTGCPFRTRCWQAQDICAQAKPALREVRPGHWAACHFAETG